MSSFGRLMATAGLFLVLLESQIMAEDKAMPGLSGEIGPTLLQLAGAMVLIIVIIYAAVWVMKKYSVGKISGGGNLITIIERRHLTPKQAIYLIKVGEKQLLIGASEAGLNKLTDIEDLGSIQTPTKQAAKTSVSKFSQILKQAKGTLMPRVSVKEKSLEA